MPLDRNLKLDADSGAEECDPTQYRQLIGSLIYLTITRPDLSYPVGLLSQFMQTPQDIHLDCAKRVLRYVSGTMDYGILYKAATPIRLERYTDAATKPIDVRPPDSFSRSVAEQYLGVARSSLPLLFRVRRRNTGAQP